MMVSHQKLHIHPRWCVAQGHETRRLPRWNIAPIFPGTDSCHWLIGYLVLSRSSRPYPWLIKKTRGLTTAFHQHTNLLINIEDHYWQLSHFPLQRVNKLVNIRSVYTWVFEGNFLSSKCLWWCYSPLGQAVFNGGIIDENCNIITNFNLYLY